MRRFIAGRSRARVHSASQAAGLPETPVRLQIGFVVGRGVTMRYALLTAAMLLPPAAFGQTVLSGTYLTPNGVSDQSTLCPGQTAYPPEWTWSTSTSTPTPRSALASDNLTPRIEQWHQGSTVANVVWTSFASNATTCQEVGRGQPGTSGPLPYTDAQLQQMANTGCGPFGDVPHVDVFRLVYPGDTFYVYPAVYSGPNNYVAVYPAQDWYAETGTIPTFAPTNVSIVGRVINGIRPILYWNAPSYGDFRSLMGPVYIDQSLGFTWNNVDVVLGPNGTAYKALIYDAAGGTSYYDADGNQLNTPVFGKTVISNSRIEGGEQVPGGINGIFGGGNVGGNLVISQNELAFNGGSNGPAHNIYLPVGLDPNFTTFIQGNYFHDATYGHLAKDRAQHAIVRGNYFQGGVPQPGFSQAEAFDFDYSNGGDLTFEENIVTKTMSGPDSNGVGLTYAFEGVPDSRKLSLTVRNNTFWAFARTYDGVHMLQPWGFFIPEQAPGSAGFPIKNPTIEYNAFGGYCPTGVPAIDFRGSVALLAGFADITQAFSFNDLWASADQSIIGNIAYLQMNEAVARADASIGAQD